MRFMNVACFALALSVAGPLAAPAARAQDATQLALAREMLVAMHAADNFEAVIPTVFQALKPAITHGDAKAAKDWDDIIPLMSAEVASAKGELIDEVAKIYARAFTADELKSFLAFYKTPAGEKLARVTPTLAQETLAAGQSFGQKVAARLAQRMSEELRKRGNKI